MIVQSSFKTVTVVDANTFGQKLVTVFSVCDISSNEIIIFFQ